MTSTRQLSEFRLATIASLAKRSERRLGRTAVMKLAFLLQSLRDYPLMYAFKLYTYGPYDSQVLEDLKVAELRGGVRSAVFLWTGGVGYEISAGDDVETLAGGAEFTEKQSDDLDWVLAEFGSRTAGDLEIASTIVFVDRELHRHGKQSPIEDVVTRVHAIKPHHSVERIQEEARRLHSRGWLT